MNRIILSGRLTKDPAEASTANGTKLCRFSLAVDRRYKSANGDKVTDFFDCTAWRTTAELCLKYLVKGNKVLVEGELQTREYEARDGSKRKATDILVENVEFLTPKGQEQPAKPHK